MGPLHKPTSSLLVPPSLENQSLQAEKFEGEIREKAALTLLSI